MPPDQLFKKETAAKQLDETAFKGLVTVTELGVAMRALETIIEQGEGSPVRKDDNHFALFKKIYDDYDERPLKYHDVKENINSDDYKDQKFHPVCLHLYIFGMCRI